MVSLSLAFINIVLLILLFILISNVVSLNDEI